MITEKDRKRIEFNRQKKAWMSEFHSKANPFEAWQWWSSEAQKSRRKAVYSELDCEGQDG